MLSAYGRDWEGNLHVNPKLSTKGLLMLYNPLKEKITRTIKLPLYYAGLTQKAKISEKEKPAITLPLNREFEATLTFTLEPESYTWFKIE